jgi:hypothetical protein
LEQIGEQRRRARRRRHRAPRRPGDARAPRRLEDDERRQATVERDEEAIDGVASVRAEASGAVTSVRRERIGIDFRANALAKRMPKNGSQTTTACENLTASVAVASLPAANTTPVVNRIAETPPSSSASCARTGPRPRALTSDVMTTPKTPEAK